jgi:hypothetical protein
MKSDAYQEEGICPVSALTGSSRQNSAAVISQADINRVIQTIHKVP